jgi:hypothetical protein
MSGPAPATPGGMQQERPTAGAVYVYGIVPAATAQQWTHDDGMQVRVITAGDLAAIVSDLPPEYVPGRREDLERHRRVLSAAIERMTAIPMRFGIVMDSDELVRERLLEHHAGEIGELLRRLDGQVQMMIRAFYTEDALLLDVLEANPDLKERSAALSGLPEDETRNERIQLGELIAQAVEERRAEVEGVLVEQLKPYASDIRVDPANSERVALQAQLLVPREMRPQLDTVVRELSDRLSGVLTFRYVGPLPPYTFADLSLEDPDEDE